MAGKKMSAEAALSKIFNITRGMISPSYVAVENNLRKKIKAKPKKAKGGKVKK